MSAAVVAVFTVPVGVTAVVVCDGVADAVGVTTVASAVVVCDGIADAVVLLLLLRCCCLRWCC